MTDPAGDLLQLADQLQAQHPDPGTPAARFIEAVGAWLDGSAGSLDAALGLSASGPGKESARRRWRRARRDEHLTESWRLTPGASSWEKSQRLDLAAYTFERDLWPAWRDQGGPPEGSSQRSAHLYAARLLGPFPGLRRLHDLCTRPRQSLRSDR